MAETIDKRAAMVDRPGVVLRWLYRRFFRAVAFEDEAAARIRAAAARGPVVYVLPAVSYMAYLYFSYALKRHALPLARFANGGVRTVLLWPLHVVFALLVVLWRFARGARVEAEEDTVARLVDDGHAVLIFLRPARVLVDDPGAASSVRGKFFEKLVALSRRRAAAGAPPVQMVPLTLVLGRPLVRLAGPRGQAKGALDTIFGEPEAPGRLRAFFQFTWHHRSSQVLVAEPLDVQAFVSEHADASDEAVARMLRFEVSGRIEQYRRVLMGPPVIS
jgi:glycerol-3-phosphate O-acyltransferase